MTFPNCSEGRARQHPPDSFILVSALKLIYLLNLIVPLIHTCITTRPGYTAVKAGALYYESM
eukprot:scaffold216353_cov17-Tisochrysis_lutea.AAC.1